MPLAVSIAIPAFNEAPRLPRFLVSVAERLRDLKTATVEVLVVDDGSRPEDLAAHRDAVTQVASGLKRHTVKLVESPRNQGKAAAIRLGWEHASSQAEWLGFLDADGAVPPHEVTRLIGLLGEGDFDALIGSRIRMAGKTIVRSEFRHWQGRVFATFTELTLKLGLYDPQCGYKLFRADRLRPLLHRLRETSWMLDLEVLSLIARAGGRIREEPIDWAETGDSKVKFGIDAARMALALGALKRRLDSEGP